MKIITQLTNLISDISQFDQSLIKLEHPANPEFGDYSTNIALTTFSKLDQEFMSSHKLTSVLDYANFLLEQLKQALAKHETIAQQIESVSMIKPGFINFKLSTQFFTQALAEVLSNFDYGKSKIGQGITWEIEHTSPNPNKAMHLGHLRNNVTGMAIARLWEAVGIKVICDAINNDRGIAIAKLMWGYLKFAKKNDQTITDLQYWFDHQQEWLSPEDLNLSSDKFVDQLYTKAAQDVESDKSAETQVRQMVIDWENKDKLTWELWRKVLDYSLSGQQQTLTRLGNRWDKIWHEHEHYQQGKDLVAQGLKLGIFKKLPDGAILTDLTKFNLPDTILQKSDGTSLYITQDLALTKLKIAEFKASKLHWVVGPEQSLALKQLFAVCDQLKIAKFKTLTHIDFGYMSIKGEGKMSSRSGNVVYVDDFIDEVKAKVKQILNNQENQTFDPIELETIAEKIAVGAVKYSILKIGRNTDTQFDFKTALKIDGNSGPYLQYTIARAKAVLRKAAINHQDLVAQFSALKQMQLSSVELKVLKLIYQFPEIILFAADTNEPSALATYIYELAQSFNSFYNQEHILQAASDHKIFRLALVKAVARILETGLAILGIDTLAQM